MLELSRTLVALASMAVRFVRGMRRPLDERAWVADEEDVASIGDPLARIAFRHAPVTGEGSADVADGIAAMVGATNYVVKNLPREGDPIPVDDQGQPIDLEPGATDPTGGQPPGWPVG